MSFMNQHLSRAILLVSLTAQNLELPSFEVASIKQNQSANNIVMVKSDPCRSPIFGGGEWERCCGDDELTTCWRS